MEPFEIWARVCERVRQELTVPMVWLAMQAARPLVIDGNYFVAALPKQDEYLAVHLQDNQATTAIEEALQGAAGRILAFRLIIGDSLAEWDAEKSRLEEGSLTETGDLGDGFGDDFDDFATTFPMSAEPPPAFFRSDASPAPAAAPPRPTRAAHTGRDVSPTWEKLSERLSQGYKTAPFIKYPHGQAQYVLTAVKIISDTMDAQMPPAGAPRDDAQERALAKVIERLSGIVNLDPMFISLELLRYREIQGKNADITL